MVKRKPQLPPKPTSKGIDSLLSENRKFRPTAAFRRWANADSASIYDLASKNPVRFWEHQLL